MERESPQYLLVQKEIYDKGYDTDDFALFVKNSIGSLTESINLNEWDLSQIQTMIHNYQEEKKRQNINNNILFNENANLRLQHGNVNIINNNNNYRDRQTSFSKNKISRTHIHIKRLFHSYNHPKHRNNKQRYPFI